ncbi:MAG: hypothetical protein R2708_05230 [Vicinamibacterales bacterium]
MVLDLPDRARLVRLKKIYFLMVRFPKWLERPLRRLIDSPAAAGLRRAVPDRHLHLHRRADLGDAVLVHLKTFAINPLRRRLPLQHAASRTPAATG